MNFKGETRKNDTCESPEALAVAVFHEGVSGESKRTYGGEATEPQDGGLWDQPGNAAACFTHVAICASSSLSPSRMSM